MTKQEDILQKRANELEIWLLANSGHADYESKNRQHNLLLSKIQARDDRNERRRYPEATCYSGLNEVSIPIKYSL